jgi:hypothetical protein
MSKRFIYCNITKQEDEYYSKIKEEHEENINLYNEKKDKVNNNFILSAGGAGGNLICCIIFLVIGIIFLRKKPEISNKKKGKKKSIQTNNDSNMNKPIGISLIILGILCFLSIGAMVYFVIQSMKNKNDLLEPITPEEYDYKIPCYSRKQNKMIGEIEEKEEEEEEDLTNLPRLPRLPNLPDAAQRIISSNTNVTNNDARQSSSSSGNTITLTDVSGIAVTGTTVNNDVATGGFFESNSNDVRGGYDKSNQSSGDIIESDGTAAGTTRETY